MPAVRSRTENWHRSLEQLCERNGSLEIAVARHYDDHMNGTGGGDNNLIWRVRLLSLSDEGIVIDQPSTLGQTIKLEKGLKLVAMMVIGQNRWMFRTEILAHIKHDLNERQRITALRLKWPQKVERCQRRAFYRVSTIALSLPKVLTYPLLDPATVWEAEEDSRARMATAHEALIRGEKLADVRPILPEVGPAFETTLVNIGGGGVGLLAEPDQNGLINRHRQYWLQLSLPPTIPVPFGVQARLAHVHVDSTQHVYMGMQFEFLQSPKYKKFLGDQICKYVTEMQREQLRRHREQHESES